MRNLIILTLAFLAAANVLVCRADSPTNAPAADKNKAFRDLFTSLFVAWDVDHDGKLTRTELNNLSKNPNLSGNASAVAVLFRDNCNKWLTLAQAQSLASNEIDQASVTNAAWRAARNFNSTSRALFLKGEPSIFSIHQGSFCSFLASLAALLYHNPEAVRNMIEPLNNGQFLVRFANGTNVIVDPITDAELRLNGKEETGEHEPHGLWLPILEKAYAKTMPGGTLSDYTDMLGQPSSTMTAMNFLSGYDVRFVWAGDEEALAGLAGNQWMATAATGEMKRLIPSISPHHAYAVLGYDSASQLAGCCKTGDFCLNHFSSWLNPLSTAVERGVLPG